MSGSQDYYANARNLAIDFLRKEKFRSPEMIAETASKAAQAQALFDPAVKIDLPKLIAELGYLFSVTADLATALDDAKDHKPWFPARRAGIVWRFWNRYVTYLERDFGMPPPIVSNLDDLTSMILERLEDPTRDPPWDRRGMVVGSVQSGKTANYTGLICKAVDAGYKLVIVLAGIHSNLRAQTQLRIDEGVLGFDTKKSRKLNTDSQWIGVGKIPGDRLVIHSLTSSAENGDFSKAMAQQIGVMLGGDPVVLVVKKNSALLGNLLTWILHIAGGSNPSGEQDIVKNIPLLLIDDEADNASINVKAKPGGKEGDTVTAINGKIRKLLDAFEKSVYVGYTATPFANIFINPEAEDIKHGEDLFPRSFIINVRPPSNYVGPVRVFGLDGDADAGIQPSEGLPIVRSVEDYEAAFPPRHKLDHVPLDLPDSLKLAMRCFVLACAARRARGQTTEHNSMLVHVTRFVNVQGEVERLVKAELNTLKRRIQFGDGKRTPTLREELQKLWEDEFVAVSAKIAAEGGSHVTWEQVSGELHSAAAKIVVMPINGYAKEALDYKEQEAEGISVIAIGGDKLSRGLTLEGLSVSYFLRTTRMYDTLMQMGRWFGYRPGYLDLCRLFTTRLLGGWYRHIASAEEELRREFDYMVAAGLTPANYGLRVRTHPDGMIVTALNKMSYAKTLQLSWSGVLAQTTQLPKDAERIGNNLSATEELLLLLDEKSVEDRASRVWTNVRAELVAGFVERLQLPPASARASGDQLAMFIRKQSTKTPTELRSWMVVLVSHKTAALERRRKIAGYEVGLLERTPEGQTERSFALKKANIMNPADEGRDFLNATFSAEWLAEIRAKRELENDVEWLEMQIGREARTVALELTKRWQDANPPKLRKPSQGETDRPNGRVLRVLRSPDRGLLLIYPLLPPEWVERGEEAVETREVTGLSKNGPPIVGVALSFPTSATTLGVEYRVNRVWGAEIEEDEKFED